MGTVTASELAKRFGIPEGTLRYWRHAGIGPRSFKVGRHVRYDEADVLAWLEKQKELTGRGDAA